MDENKKCEVNNKNVSKGIKKLNKTKGKKEKSSDNNIESKSKETLVKSAITENHKPSSEESDSKTLEAELRKIAKKKAKKLAQKLKKKDTKEQASAINIAGKEEGENNEKECKLDKTQGEAAKNNVVPRNTDTKTKKEKKKIKRSNQTNNPPKDQNQNEHNSFAQCQAATIFVGNLPVNTKRVQLLRLFKDIGTIRSIRLRTAAGKPIYKNQIKKNAGSLNAYIVFENKGTAESALKLNGIEFKSNHLRITPADKATLKSTLAENVKRTVFVGNLKYSVTEESLREVFSSCGEIDYIRCLRNEENQCKGVAYVCFKKPDAVGLALELNETMLEERPIHVERYSLKKQGAKEARDTASNQEIKSKPKQKPQRNDKNGSLQPNNKNNINLEQKTDKQEPQKNNKYKGVKVDPMKSKLKLKKKNKISNNELNKMVKKIAPKSSAKV